MSRSDGKDSLERAAATIAEEWGVQLGPRFSMARHAFVAPAGEDAVLKITPALDDESDHEPAALGGWSGDGAVRLIRHDPERRAVLTERASPGRDLASVPEDQATVIAIRVARRLWRPATEPYRWIGDYIPTWLDEAERGGASDPGLLTIARDIYQGLDVGRDTLIHGDLHHHNILDAGGGRWVAIDPKPMRGEREFDVAPFLWNPVGRMMSRKTTERRLELFEQAGLDQRRMRWWAVIRGAYLSVDPGTAAILRRIL
jgi:streptomycin 6-kinase